jgi:lethal(2) giant larvae protein
MWCIVHHCSYAVGTAHGVALIHYLDNRILLAQCTLDPHASLVSSDLPSSTGQSALNRGRSLKKSLRESFRRLRKGRTIKKATMISTMRKRIDEANSLVSTSNRFDETVRVPVERQVEFRDLKPIQEYIASMVRCLYFAKTHLSSGMSHS